MDSLLLDPEKTSDGPIFQHRRLGPNEIRLIKIRQGCDFDEIRCTIHHYTLRELPPYVSISYRWGTSEERIPIELNSRLFEVMTNAWWALRHQRKHQIDSYVWLDAICIDQSNVGERNAQVQLMGEIFSKANEVIVWLGLDDEWTAAAFDALQSLMMCRELRTTPHHDDLERSADAVGRLLQREYWSRIWVVQDILLAQKLTLACGDQRVPWLSLELLFAGWSEHVSSWKPPESFLTSVSKTPARVLVEDRLEQRFIHTNTMERGELSDRLFTYRTKKCLDRRDKIYGLVCLFAKCTVVPFVVNYARSAEDLLLYALAYVTGGTDTKAMYKQCTNFQIILECNARGEKFQNWLQSRLGFQRQGTRFQCHLDSGEMVELPLAVNRAGRNFTVAAMETLQLGYLSWHEIRTWLDSSSALNVHASMAANWLYANQAAICSFVVNVRSTSSTAFSDSHQGRRGSHSAALTLPSYAFEHIARGWSEAAELGTGSAPKAICNDTDLLGVVCAAAQDGDMVYTLKDSTNDSHQVVIRPSGESYTVIGNAILATTAMESSHKVFIFLDPLNALVLSGGPRCEPPSMRFRDLPRRRRLL